MRLQLPRFFSFILILSFLLISSAFAQSENPESYRQDRVIIKLKNATTTNVQNNLRAALNVSRSKLLELIGAQVWELSGITADDAIARFKDNPNIEYIEPDYTLYAVKPVSRSADGVQVFPNDLRFPEMWGLHNTGQNGGTPDADIDAPEAWSITTGKEIVIGVIDSGTDWKHVDLAGNIWINQGEIPDNGIDDDKNGYVDDVRGWDFFGNDNDPMDEAGHGTHVSGTIAAIGNNKIGTVGVNWSAKIMILRFLGPDGNGSTSDAIQAIEYAMRMNAHLTNNSWGGGQFSQALKDAIEAVGTAGQLFIAAAGNTGLNSDMTPHYPACYDLGNIISVANTMRNDVLSANSTYGVVTVDLAAPGTNVLSTLPGNSYGNFSGTSMASPHVAGVASLLLSIDPAMTPVALKDLIMANVDTLESLEGKVATSGRLNAHKTLLAAEQDSIAPAPVIDLQAGEPTSNSIILRWTASGDDSTAGKAAAYDIRYSVEPIDAKNFQFAEIAANPAAPQEAGTPERFIIKGLDFSTTYYAALRVIDNVGNESDISNLASAATLGAPNIVVSKDSLSDELLTGATSIQTFNIKNDAEGTLDFGINIEGVSASHAITAIRISTPQSDEKREERKAQYELAIYSRNFVSWLSAAPVSGTVFAGDSAAVTVTFDAFGLNAGGFDAKINISSNDPGDSLVAIPAHLNVIGAPDIFAKIDTLDFGGIFTGQTDTLRLLIENKGTDVLDITGVVVQPAEFSVVPAVAIIAPGDAATFSIVFAPENSGELAGTLSFTSNDPDEQVFTIALKGKGVPPPVIGVSPDSLSEQLFTGELSQQSLTVVNDGGSDLNFAIEITGTQNSGMSMIIRDENFTDSIASREWRKRKGFVPQLLDSDSDIPPDGAPTVSPPGLIAPEAATLPFRDGFEDGDFADWFIDDTTGQREITNETAARGQNSFHYSNAIQGHFHGIHQEFDASQPKYMGFYIRSGSSTQSDAYFLITANGENRNSVILFFARSNGFFFANGSTPGGDESFKYNANQWYHIEFKDVNWAEKHFDYYVDGDLITEDIPFRNTSLVNSMDRVYLYNFASNAQAWWDEVTIGDPGSLWLDAKPLKGTIVANSQLEIDVLFDANGLKGDVYRANLEISSNDPVTPKMAVPVSLQVSDAPDIAVSKDSLNYGEVFTGVNVADTLEVANNGTDTLKVTGIVTGREDFSVDPASFDLSPGAKQLVTVILNASAQEEIVATLKITSNDPDESELPVALTATVLFPPKISVAPDSLGQALFTGDTATQILTISNEKADGDTLDFSISVIENDSAASTLSMRYRIIGQMNAAGTDARKSISQTRSNQGWGDHSATGLQISGGKITRQNDYSGNPLLPIVIADPEGDGGIVDVISLRALSGPEFVDFQIDLSTIIDPAYFGGAVSLDLDQNPNTGTPPSFGMPEQDIGAEYELFFFNLSTGLVQLMRGPILIANYPVEISDKSLRFSVLLADVDNDDGLIDVTGVLGTSSSPTDWFPDAGHGTIQKGVNWLLPDPLSGSIPGGAGLEIEVTFNANGLDGGDYFADIAVSSNDPFSPLVTLPAHLAVTSAPDIALSDSSLAFGEVFIGFTKQDSFLVANKGTDALQVISITSDNPEFTIDVSAFSIEPDESHTVLLAYAPTTEQTSTGILVIRSNDPDEPVAEVKVTGQGLFPPDIAIDPARFDFFVNPGDSVSAVMAITNNGSSPLRFSIRDEEQEANAPGNDENLFWGVTADAAVDTLYRTDFNNAKTEAIFLGNGLRGLAIDEDQQRIYFAVTGDGAIRVSDFDGSNEHFILKGLNSPVEIALDNEAGKIYWVDFAENLIARANVDGSDLEVIILGIPTSGNTGVAPNEMGDATATRGSEKTLALNRPWGIALDLLNSKVYWTEQSGNRIARANLDGTEEETIIALADSINGPRGIEVDPAIGKIFFVDSFNGMIKRANLDGSEIETLLTFESSDNALSLALDRIAQKIYWTDNGADEVSRANYSGSDVEIVVKTNVTGYNGPFGLAVTPRTGWLSKTPAQGTLEAGESADILLNVDATGLEEGDYAATIFVESNDPDESRVEIPISLRVNKAQVVLSTPDTLQTLPGDTLNVPVAIFFVDTTAEISALGAAMKASGNMLTFLGYTPGPILSGQVFNINSPSPDSVRMALIALNQAPLSQPGLLATLHFQVDTAAAGDDFIMKFSDLSAGDLNGQSIPIAAIDGRVSIRTHTITGTILYSMVDGKGDRAKPVAGLDVELVQSAGVVQRTKTAESGEYELLNIRPGRDYRVKVWRKSGGTAAALTPTDALLVVQAFLGTIAFTGSQNLAADADGNQTINPTDAGLIFNRFLGRISQFPIDDWRTYPSNYNNNEPADAWKTTPGSKDYRNLQNNFADQDYLAVAIGDVDLSWPEPAPSAGANSLAKGKSTSQNAASLNLQVSAAELSPFTKETNIQILADGDVLANGVYALGGELRYDAASLEVLSVRWGEITPKDGFNTDYRILSENSVNANNQNQNEDRHLASGRIRFGGFSTSDARINSAGVLLEVDVRLISEHISGTALPLTLVDLSAVYGGENALLVDRKNSASSATRFIVANISASDGAVVVSAPPKKFALEQNYPNPFNPTTRIRYQLPKVSQVRIVLFNAIGHKILALVDNETQDAGYYTIEWNGRDTAGRSVASGVYLYRIEAVGANHSFANTRKMLLIK